KDIAEILADIPFTKVEEPLLKAGDFHIANTQAFYGNQLTDIYEDYISSTDSDRKKSLKAEIKSKRGVGKVLGLALAYRGSPNVIKNQLNCSEKESKRLYDNFFRSLRVFKNYSDRLTMFAEDNLYVQTFLKRPMWLFELDDPNFKWKGLNKVVNSPTQGGGAELIKLIIFKTGRWIEQNNLYRLQNNNITKQYIKRVVSVKETDINLEALEGSLEKLEKGNTLVLILAQDGSVVSQWDSLVTMNKSTMVEFNLKLEF
ncbi:DNA polymerase I family protein with 3'-5'-exonuclease and polymerase domains, partial [Thiovulum sp. ES]